MNEHFQVDRAIWRIIGRRRESRQIGSARRNVQAAVRNSGSLRGGTIDSHGDHRLAMLGAVAGLASEEGVTVENMEAAAVSYPSFEADLAGLAG